EIFTVHNSEIFEEAYKNKKGVILLSGHMGNFEWLGQMHGQMGNKIYGIAKRLKNPLVNQLVEKNRLRENMGVIYTKKAMKDGIQVLKNNNLLAIVMDQDAKKKGVFVNFLGLPSSAAVGPAVFHLKTGAPLIFLMSIRRDYGKFDAYYEEICPASGSQEVNDENILRITQKHMSVLEKWVLRYPEQWFWMHRRWKTKQKNHAEQS
ncbi:MAG: lysophospholipid acyltransferase family protein, partial [Calditrichaceae bacterium]